MVDYSPLWDTMQKRKITQYTLLKDKVLDNHTLDRLKKRPKYNLGSIRTHMQISVLHAQRCRIIYR